MRDTTERPEGIAAGTLKLVGTEEETIYHNFKELLENPEVYHSMSTARRTITLLIWSSWSLVRLL